jgi:(1->4)-alpha-D-glucan 1-alpha-D-glucosylmutase
LRVLRANPEVFTKESSGISECLDRLAAEKRSSRPVSTYRMQLNAGFRFEHARRLAGYFRALGVSHLYSSPILKARPGSPHGYDITDHTQLNPEIGSEKDLQALVRELKNYGMGQVLDFVPNHMGIGFGANPWWSDVLANGRASEFADFFDLDWDPLKPELRDKLLLPVLGDQYGAELEAGHIRLVCDDEGLHVAYYDKRFPLDPRSMPIIFEAASPKLDAAQNDDQHREEACNLRSLLQELGELPPHSETDLERVKIRRSKASPLLESLARLLRASPWIRQLAQEAIERCNGKPGDLRSFDCLHRLLEAQVYRLANWRVSGEEINYRRFFDINDLIGLRMEDPRVFAATHQLLRRLLASDTVQGLRIDHCDGLLNPLQYLIRLQMLYAASQCLGEEPSPPLAENGIELEMQDAFGRHDWLHDRPPCYVVVEKILLPGEDIPAEWLVDGTSGYEFTALVNGLFIDGGNEERFTELYHQFIGSAVDLDLLIYNSKKLIMHSSLASEVNVLAHLLDEISVNDRYARDFTRKALRDVIRETIACFPVYRTYIDERGEVTARDVAYINLAIRVAKRRNPDKAPASLSFLRDILLLKRRESEDQPAYRKKLYFTLKFQQLTGPVMAKGLEDTTFYIYNRFVANNEIGGSPKQFGVTPEQFHESNQQRAREHPFSMLATSTHDTKRSEDVRARLDVLSEMPRAWRNQVLRWQRVNQPLKPTLSDGRTVPDANEEYLLYQTLVGTWPFAIAGPEARQDYVSRIQQYMTKAVHEAKVNLSWINPDPGYVEALQHFVEQILAQSERGRPNRFLERFLAFLPPVIFYGAINALAQRLLLITSPGNPDIYQGTELWDFSLVDPDNRRPVDYALRRQLLAELDRRSESGDLPALCAELLENFRDGRIKLWTTMQALRLRRERRELFHSGMYTPLQVRGSRRQHVVSFARERNGETVIVAVPRLSLTLTQGDNRFPLGKIWDDSEILLPFRSWETLENVFTGEEIRVNATRSLSCGEVFGHFPVALLASC